MTKPLTGLGRRGIWPDPHVCRACGSARNASRGFPGDVWFCAPCVPPDMRFPHEPGFAPAAAGADLPVIAALPVASPDLLSGLSPT